MSLLLCSRLTSADWGTRNCNDFNSTALTIQKQNNPQKWVAFVSMRTASKNVLMTCTMYLSLYLGWLTFRALYCMFELDGLFSTKFYILPFY